MPDSAVPANRFFRLASFSGGRIRLRQIVHSGRPLPGALVQRIARRTNCPKQYVGKYPIPPPLQCMSCKHPRASSGGVSPRYFSNVSFQTPGTSSAFNPPSISACSISKRSMMCKLYVASSASTRIYEGATALIAA